LENKTLKKARTPTQEQSQESDNKHKPKKLLIKVIAVILILIGLVGLCVVISKLKNNLNAQRNVILAEQAKINEYIDGYNESVMPFLLDCMAYSKIHTSDYDTVLKAKQVLDVDKNYENYKALKTSVDGFINYTKIIDGLADTVGYKQKLDILNAYSINISNSVKNYNQLVNNYSVFRNNFKYKFISNSKEFSLMEE
jgi:hypothetical protein